MDSNKIKVMALLDDAIVDGASSVIKPWGVNRVFHATLSTSSGAGSASVALEMSNDGENFVTRDTLSLTNASEAVVDSEYKAYSEAWVYVRATLSALTGTGATVNLYVSED